MKKSEKIYRLEDALGFLCIKAIRGINLAIRDLSSSDPYVTFSLPNKTVKTRTIKKSLNPQWNDDLTLAIWDPNEPIKVAVYDHDTFSRDDKMGNAEFDIRYFIEAVRMNLNGVPDGTVITKVTPNRQNCIAEESCIVWMNGEVTQKMFLRLRDVECGEIEIQLKWMVNTQRKVA